MYEEFIAERLMKLRRLKERSAREMSLILGQNQNYINHIENKKMLPSMQSFFYICEFLGITPQEFFDLDNPQPEALNELVEDLKKLDGVSMSYIMGIVKMLAEKQPQPEDEEEAEEGEDADDEANAEDTEAADEAEEDEDVAYLKTQMT